MKRLPAYIFAILLGLICVSQVQAVTPQSGGSTVKASVNNPSQTPTRTPTPTPLIVLTGTPTPTTSLGNTPTPTPGTGGGTEGDIYLDISGFASPHASVVMTSNDLFIRATVADSQGNFFISQIKVASGFSQFCLENIDFQRIGDSLTCFEIPPVTASTSKKDIFLPPSLGLSNKKTTPTSFVYGFGYTMPSSQVVLKVSEGINLKSTADKNGYYKVKVENLAVGKYELFAKANYQGKDSEKPSKTQELNSLSPGAAAREQFFSSIWELIKRFGWIVIPILILIFILFSKRLRDRIKTTIRRVKDREEVLPKPGEHLHHYWFIGY